MTFGVDMAELATDLIADFSTEIGTSTIRHNTGESYDTTTGTSTPTYSDHVLLIAFDEIQSEEVQEESYLKNHQMAIVAGNDITITPEEGDLVTKPAGTTHKIVAVMTDQYEAAYFCHIQRKPE
jgi:hypothetical protein